MKSLGLLLVFSASLCFTRESATPTQLTQVPPKPTCVLLFRTGTCADLWRNYNQALQQRTREELQLYVNRQKDLASSQATAPLQQQIDDLNRLASDQQGQIKKLSDQVQADSDAALQAKADDANAVVQARISGLKEGAGIGVLSTLGLFGLIFGIRRLRS